MNRTEASGGQRFVGWLAVCLGVCLVLGLRLEGHGQTGPQSPEWGELEKVADGLSFPEGPAWDGKDTLYVSNCNGDWITKIGPEGAGVFLRASTEPFTFQKTNGLTVFGDGTLFACDFGEGAIVKLSPEGQSEVYAGDFGGQRFRRPNDLAFDPEGNLYFTDPNAYRGENPDGTLYRVAAETREVTPVATGLAFPNGLAFSADAKQLYVCESALHRIVRFDVRTEGGLAKPEVFAELPGGDPDGINFDRAGRLYVAHFGGGAVWVFSPEGRLEHKIPLPGKKPSNVEFAGEDLRTLYITECETNAVYRLRVETPGLPLFSSPR